ncbi:MAG: hypothetical protein Q7V62_07235 [Actinomycetota bacterium]|nr:hypothetical protein [Actinomycetota bacterium]
MAENMDLDHNLELVRRGYDPHQVQRLVGALRDELKAVATENAELRAHLADPSAPVPAATPESVTRLATPASDEAIAVWASDTLEMLAASRANLARVMEQADVDGAALVAAAEQEAATIRESAEAEAARILEEATTRAGETVSQAERQAAANVADAEAHRAAVEAEIQMLKASAQADLDQRAAELHSTTQQLADLEARRRGVSEQLLATRAQIDSLFSLVDDSPAASREKANEQL